MKYIGGLDQALCDELSSDGENGIIVTGVYPYHVNNSMFAGVTTRFPFLFSPIKEDDLAIKIVDAVLTNRAKLIVPKLMYLVACFYSVAPLAVVNVIMKFTRVHKSMDQYHEHRQKMHGHS